MQSDRSAVSFPTVAGQRLLPPPPEPARIAPGFAANTSAKPTIAIMPALAHAPFLRLTTLPPPQLIWRGLPVLRKNLLICRLAGGLRQGAPPNRTRARRRGPGRGRTPRARATPASASPFDGSTRVWRRSWLGSRGRSLRGLAAPTRG